jgi:predicted RNA binding protein YcfA (HicA-like mRNA interferase family)
MPSRAKRPAGNGLLDRKRLLLRLSRSRNNVSFSDFIDLVEGFGFQLVRVHGSHHIYANRAIQKSVNLQPDHGEAKPYQVQQFLRLVEKYELSLREEQ